MKLFTRTDSKITRKTARIFWDNFLQDKRVTIPATSAVFISHLLRYVIIPLLLSLIIQSLLHVPSQIDHALWLLGGIATASIVTTFCNTRGLTRLFKHEIEHETRQTVWITERILHQSYGFHANNKVGALAGDVRGFAKAYSNVLDTISMTMSPVVINFTASLIVIAILSPILLIPMFLVTIGVVLLVMRSIVLRAPYRNQRKIYTSQLNGVIADTLGNSLLVKIFTSEQRESRNVGLAAKSVEIEFLKENPIIERESTYRFAVLFIFQFIVLLVGIYLFSISAVSVAALIFTITYLGRLSENLFTLAPAIKTIEQAFLDAAPMVEMLSEPIEVVDAADAYNLDIDNGGIVFDDVSFAYGDADKDTIFDHLNLTIKAGERIGLAGHSGGGKTTLTKLLLRFADINSGRILIDSQDIAEATQESLRSAIAYVPQDPFLFHRSLRENIAYGKPDATDEEIVSAARKAYAMEFIDTLPAGLDTIVGERGIKLSGGQRQRIAIARAILKDAPILILDEATSALDSESEKLIQQSLETLMQGRTSIVIAHRLSTIAKLDRIIVLDDGKIVEDGTHTELLKQNGTYAKLWNHQSGGFIEG